MSSLNYLFRFAITLEELEAGEEIATCPSCSLIVKVFVYSMSYRFIMFLGGIVNNKSEVYLKTVLINVRFRKETLFVGQFRSCFIIFQVIYNPEDFLPEEEKQTTESLAKLKLTN